MRWICKTCGQNNSNWATKCGRCDTDKPMDPAKWNIPIWQIIKMIMALIPVLLVLYAFIKAGIAMWPASGWAIVFIGFISWFVWGFCYILSKMFI